MTHIPIEKIETRNRQTKVAYFHGDILKVINKLNELIPHVTDLEKEVERLKPEPKQECTNTKEEAEQEIVNILKEEIPHQMKLKNGTTQYEYHLHHIAKQIIESKLLALLVK